MYPAIGAETGKILLLSEPGSFTAVYIRRYASLFGIPLIESSGDPRESFANLTAEDWESLCGCIAADVGPALYANIATGAKQIPCLFVGFAGGGWFPGPYAWLAPPFSSCQIIETLFAMMKP
jgi:hypothetical protein